MISNILIAIAYYSIPVALLVFVRRRQDLVHKWVFVLFALFIFGCGTTHIVKVITIWYPVYWLQGIVDGLTATVSVVTAIALWPLIPHLLAIPSRFQLEQSNQSLQAEILERQSIEMLLNEERAALEQRVIERTAELERINRQLQQEIAEHQRAEEALRQSEDHFRHLADAMPQLVWTAESTGKVDYYNQRWREFKGLTPTEDGWEWQPILHPDDQQPTVDAWNRALATGETYEIEHRIHRADGEVRWYLSRALPVRSDEGQINCWYGTATDIHYQKQGEAERERLLAELTELTEKLETRVRERTQQVRDLAIKLSLAEQQERKRVSQIIHDHVQQMLYAIQWRIHLISLDLSAEQQARLGGQIEDMGSLINQAIQSARTLTVELSPPVLRNEGLPEAILWLGAQMKEMHELTVSVQFEGDCRVGNQGLRVMIFQIIRELLFNVVKHAGVDQAYVTLQRVDDHLIATVRDRGKGFEPHQITPHPNNLYTGWGIQSIKEQLALFDGSVHIEAAPNAGAQITLYIPLMKEEADEDGHEITR
ncbi:MAG: PAS domain-containing protein [Caldilineaceae bacterium]|nr:PAS domain-containing protein [Caldilineaceae bacterium]